MMTDDESILDGFLSIVKGTTLKANAAMIQSKQHRDDTGTSSQLVDVVEDGRQLDQHTAVSRALTKSKRRIFLQKSLKFEIGLLALFSVLCQM